MAIWAIFGRGTHLVRQSYILFFEYFDRVLVQINELRGRCSVELREEIGKNKYRDIWRCFHAGQWRKVHRWEYTSLKSEAISQKTNGAIFSMERSRKEDFLIADIHINVYIVY